MAHLLVVGQRAKWKVEIFPLCCFASWRSTLFLTVVIIVLYDGMICSRITAKSTDIGQATLMVKIKCDWSNSGYFESFNWSCYNDASNIIPASSLSGLGLLISPTKVATLLTVLTHNSPVWLMSMALPGQKPVNVHEISMVSTPPVLFLMCCSVFIHFLWWKPMMATIGFLHLGPFCFSFCKTSQWFWSTMVAKASIEKRAKNKWKLSSGFV